MREAEAPPLDRTQGPPLAPAAGAQRTDHCVRPVIRRLGVVGRGRAGSALASAFRKAGLVVVGPAGRDEVPVLPEGDEHGLDAVLLCVPDAAIVTAARSVSGAAPLVGHTSGATPLSALAESVEGPETFALHPLQTLTGAEDSGRLAGAGCAVAGSTGQALDAARELAEAIGLVPFEIADSRRAAYHAAASAASNFLVTLQDVAEAIAAGAGIPAAEARRALLPLVRATVENWGEVGPERALTGPVARGDERTIAAQRAAVERTDPALVPVFDALLERTRHLAERARGGGSP